MAPKEKAVLKDKPKRGSSGYNLYIKAELEKLKKSNPDASHKERFTNAAVNWKKLSDAERAAWNTKAGKI